MVGRWSWVSVGIGAAWLLAFAGVALWEFRTAEPFSLRGGQAGLPYSWTALVLILGGPIALLATLACCMLAVIRRYRTPGTPSRLWLATIGPAIVIGGG